MGDEPFIRQSSQSGELVTIDCPACGHRNSTIPKKGMGIFISQKI
jgi:hypothetical protein